MIKNKELGVVITENDDETAWFNFAENTRAEIKQMKGSIARAEKDLKMGDRVIAMRFKNGAKALIKRLKQNIKVSEELLVVAEGKLKTKV